MVKLGYFHQMPEITEAIQENSQTSIDLKDSVEKVSNTVLEVIEAVLEEDIIPEEAELDEALGCFDFLNTESDEELCDPVFQDRLSLRKGSKVTAETSRTDGQSDKNYPTNSATPLTKIVVSSNTFEEHPEYDPYSPKALSPTTDEEKSKSSSLGSEKSSGLLDF